MLSKIKSSFFKFVLGKMLVLNANERIPLTELIKVLKNYKKFTINQLQEWDNELTYNSN